MDESEKDGASSDGDAIEEDARGASGQRPEEVANDIANFILQVLALSVGTTITWMNRDGALHTTTAGTSGNLIGVWDSSVFWQGEPFSFIEAGSFAYFCTIHPSMQATVTVTE